MRILLLGSGGREHALAWKLNQSSVAHQIFIAPGNPGTATCGKNVELDLKDFDSIGKLCLNEKIEMVIVGPEEPLVNGLYDFFKSNPQLEKIHFIGPSKKGAVLEGSKAWAKSFMQRHQIPTATYREFNNSNFEEGVRYVDEHTLPVVLKADGLAAGKGVIICQTHIEAVAELELMLQEEKFGEAGKKVVVEEFLQGIELSVFVVTDGKNFLLLPSAKDYKRVGEGDSGLNTGGMGAVSPVPFATPEFMEKVKNKIILPTIKGIHEEGIDYTGFLFFGLMNVEDEPYVIEYNCRLGDPEAEVILPRIKNDLVEILVAATQQKLNTIQLETDDRAAVTVMAVSGGYPGHFEKGFEISGLENDFGKNSLIFQAGTKKENGNIVTNGGRVLCVTSFGSRIDEAAATSLGVLAQIDFKGIYYRSDIGYEFVPTGF